ncbi:hypothetical protein [Pseudomonas syringae]|uniref:hypothetical protein n=1 Tax=Pseudomonas syringae TaxID=317 RepID=UPI0003456E03|nr:hypothetical protein [Pseudomonas syringae]
MSGLFVVLNYPDASPCPFTRWQKWMKLHISYESALSLIRDIAGTSAVIINRFPVH